MITASQVKDLREKTGVGMMQCKAALTESGGDMEKAIELLRKRGEMVAAKRADKAANEGCVFLLETNSKAVVAELNCETDFVGASEDFQSLGSDALKILSEKDIADVAALLEEKTESGLTLAQRVNDVLAKLGENIGVKRFVQVSVGEQEASATYSHMGGKIGVLVKLAFEGTPSDAAALKIVAKDLCMQVAATSPASISEADLDPVLVAKEREIYRGQALEQGTKEEFVDRVVDGRVNKFLKEICLQEQMFVKDSKKSINDLLKETAAAQGITALKISHFTRMELGK
jgi:elongation factor Ts